MTWREEFRQPSFRGVPFKFRSHDASGGRRVSVDEFPRGEEPRTEDMGGSPRTYRLDAHILGPDYLTRARALEEALEQKGPGRLIHPFLGALWVHCVRWRRAEDSKDGGIVVFSLAFIEASDGGVGLTVGDDAIARVDEAAEAAKDASEETIAGDLQSTGNPEYVRSPIREASAAIANRLKKLESFSDRAEDAAQQASEISELLNVSADLLTAPADLASSIRVAIDRVAGSFDNALGAFYAYRLLFGLSLDEDSGIGFLSVIADQNGRTVTENARAMAAAGATRAAVRVDWAAREDAVTARQAILAEIDELLETAGDSAFIALQRLRGTAIEQIPNPAVDLPQIGIVQLAQSQSSLVVSFREYGTPDRADEIVSRNRVRHPAFLPAGVPLEVLQDA